jgi:ferredoxin like protein
MKQLSLDERLALDRYEFDEQSHIELDQSLCKVCEKKPCLTVCPAGVYKLAEGETVANYEDCLECGACQIACDKGGEGGIDWTYPRSGFGIAYRYG